MVRFFFHFLFGLHSAHILTMYYDYSLLDIFHTFSIPSYRDSTYRITLIIEFRSLSRQDGSLTCRPTVISIQLAPPPGGSLANNKLPRAGGIPRGLHAFLPHTQPSHTHKHTRPRCRLASKPTATPAATSHVPEGFRCAYVRGSCIEHTITIYIAQPSDCT